MNRTLVRGRVLLAACTLMLVGGCDAGGSDGPIAVGSAAPGFAAATLAGDTVSLAALRGEHVLVNIWATWCAPCREEMPDLQEIHEDYSGRGLRVVGVSIDQGYARDDIQAFVERYGIGFTILHDSESRITRSYRTIGVPETFLISSDGTLLARWFGQIDPAVVRRAIDTAGVGRVGSG